MSQCPKVAFWNLGGATEGAQWIEEFLAQERLDIAGFAEIRESRRIAPRGYRELNCEARIYVVHRRELNAEIHSDGRMKGFVVVSVGEITLALPEIGSAGARMPRAPRGHGRSRVRRVLLLSKCQSWRVAVAPALLRTRKPRPGRSKDASRRRNRWPKPPPEPWDSNEGSQTPGSPAGRRRMVSDARRQTYLAPKDDQGERAKGCSRMASR